MDQKLYEYDLDLTSPIAPARVVRLVGDGKRVLEVGCSSGASTKVLTSKMNCRVTGLEINPEAAEVAKRFCDRVITGDIEQIDLASLLGEARFDVITFGDVLEHLRNPLAVLRKVRPFLADGGCLVVSVPNMAHVSIAFELLHGRFDYQPKGLLDDTHVRFFTRKNLLRMLEDADFTVTVLERVEVAPERTEFGTNISTPEQHAILAYANRHNLEACTYQYVVKAIPVAPGAGLGSSSTAQVRERLSDLEALSHKREREIAALESKLSWIESRPPLRAWRWLSRIVGSRK
ncbi:class I SAM-dependent methyltransferase [Methyloversatilis sp. XJ19-13]|uniref:class I SAM-dependent methyltransferase n=1 Tax=Methyloversatilis sp. XJ19-13 TaxID=2963430 RepID=UPI00211B773B|nr:class I SAM-dependent methyltransferase [Methyloversatilis sp. XJ19-13]MCQ9372929.1 class I SAM-dependent methyltransferase [Methyloversatilis sp. XJ19-13]